MLSLIKHWCFFNIILSLSNSIFLLKYFYFYFSVTNIAKTLSVIENTLSDDQDQSESRAKIGKKYRKYMLPLLLAYKLKFFALIPLMMGGLVLLAGSTGFAGFFFALFAATMGLKVGGHN